MAEQRPLAAVLGAELDLRLWSYRDFTPLRAGQVDDEPYGGGAGMVLRVDVADAAVAAVYGDDRPARIVALSPQGPVPAPALGGGLPQEPRAPGPPFRFQGLPEGTRQQPPT